MNLIALSQAQTTASSEFQSIFYVLRRSQFVANSRHSSITAGFGYNNAVFRWLAAIFFSHKKISILGYN